MATPEDEQSRTRQLMRVIIRGCLDLSTSTEAFYRTLGDQATADSIRKARQEKERLFREALRKNRNP